LVAAEAMYECDLFWFARIVHHTIGDEPLGEVAAWLHRDLRARVGLE
jgi:hypothetical protein